MSHIEVHLTLHQVQVSVEDSEILLMFLDLLADKIKLLLELTGISEVWCFSVGLDHQQECMLFLGAWKLNYRDFIKL